MSEFAKNIFVRIAHNYNIALEQWGHDRDHVHAMFRAHPNTELSKFINSYKSGPALSRRIFLLSVQNSGRKCSGQEVSAY